MPSTAPAAGVDRAAERPGEVQADRERGEDPGDAQRDGRRRRCACASSWVVAAARAAPATRGSRLRPAASRRGDEAGRSEPERRRRGAGRRVVVVAIPAP